jgi:predicted ATPase
MIQEIRLANFKSFGPSTTIPLAPFSVFIGPNAAGKSNLIDAFRFLQECVEDGVETAAARRYGWSHLRCRRRRSVETSLKLEWVSSAGEIKVGVETGESREITELSFHYSLTFDRDFTVVHETGSLSGVPEGEEQKQAVSVFQRDRERVKLREFLGEEQTFPVREANRNRLFISARFQSLAALVISEVILNWRFYDFLPNEARRPAEMRFPYVISETGDNLAAVLHQLPSDNGHLRERLLELMQSLVPEFEDWETEQLPDGRISFKVREKGARGAFLPIAISDGTIRLLATLTALLGPQGPGTTIFIEEPERSLHPFVLEQLVQLMREVSRTTQVIVTTHSTEFVSYCLPEEVYLMDKIDGCTRIGRVDEIDHIREFLKHFTLGELWVRRYLEETE